MIPKNRLTKYLKPSEKDINEQVDNIIKFDLGEERDKSIAWQRERDLMARRFKDWHHDFINRPKTPDQLIEAFQALIQTVNETLKESVDLRDSTIDIIFQKITIAHNLSDMWNKAGVTVEANCGICNHYLRSPEPIPIRVFLSKSYHLLCTNCGSEVKADECRKVKGTK